MVCWIESAATAADQTTNRECPQPGGAYAAAAGTSQLTIHGIPNRSTVMPKPADQNVFWNGMVTLPPADSSVKMRSASSGLGTVTDTVIPCGALYRSGGASDPISVSPPTVIRTCITRPCWSGGN